MKKHVSEVHCGSEKRFCKICGKSFAGIQVLKFHIKTVHDKSDVKRFKCDKCEMCFSINYKLQRHKSIHDENREKFQCNDCGKEFTDIYQARRHKNTVHSKSK